jgi:hypothetical protein
MTESAVDVWVTSFGEIALGGDMGRIVGDLNNRANGDQRLKVNRGARDRLRRVDSAFEELAALVWEEGGKLTEIRAEVDTVKQ